MFQQIFIVLENLLIDLTIGTVDLINAVAGEIDINIRNIDINLVLLSDTPILATNLYDLTSIFFTFFYSVFFIVLLYKVTKKVIRSVFGVLKWW